MTSFLPRLVGVGSVKLIRSFHRSCRLSGGSYEGDGKTTVTILNRDAEYGLMVDTVGSVGFKLNSGLWVLGPMILFPRSVIGWNIGSSEEITEDSLTLFKTLDPKLDILVVGLDQKYDTATVFLKTIIAFTTKHKISVEILPVEHACSTFNFLNAEHRFVAAALMPPKTSLPKGLVATEEAMMRSNLRKPNKRIE